MRAAWRAVAATLWLSTGLFLTAPLARAAETAPVRTGHATASLITESDTADGQAPLPVALSLHLQDGWHTYWRNPGDAGDPVSVSVTASGALEGEAQTILWPTPRRISEFSLMSYAYTGDVILPLLLPLRHAQGEKAAQTTLTAHAHWLVCEQVCVPEEADFSLTLPVGPQHPAPQAPLFERAAQQSPVASPYPATISPDGVLRLMGADLNPRSVADAWFMPDERGQIVEAAAQAPTIQDGSVTLHLHPTADFAPAQGHRQGTTQGQAPGPDGISGIVVLKDPAGEERALHVQATPVAAARPASSSTPVPGAGLVRDAAPNPLLPAPSSGPPASRPVSSSPLPPGSAPYGAVSAPSGMPEGLSMAGLMAFAWLGLMGFAGGLVLNLMPCVFPILAMKALALVRMGGHARHVQRYSAVGYAAGVLAGFMVLGGLVMGLRLAGGSVGWGFQFQSPLFVGMVLWLLFGMALNLLGVFTLFLSVPGARTLRPNQPEAPIWREIWHNVLTGLLAVAVASPCSAPFMGVAIAGALSAPPAAGLAIFAALGAGLAAPYVLLAFYPRLAEALPRPGVWMDYLKQFLAFPLLGSCVWLLWVATLQGGATATVLLGAGLVMLGAAAWLYGIAQREQMRDGADNADRFLRGLALLSLLAALGLLPVLKQQTDIPAGTELGNTAAPVAMGTAKPDAPATSGANGTEPFSPQRLAALHDAGRPVFIDMTAAWCITCLINERVALDTQAARAAFARQGVVFMRGDWTRHDSAITTFLQQHGRDGVPFYLFVPAHGAEVTLPQILTPNMVINAISPPS
ncbi:thioredoxin family protein [Acetobacter sp. TBRC 12305]|uniref:Thioredoxin family protein n=2 Tax=Acetobacter garciniae TaxID=2817435 RepID=A0A939KRM0_9PROT|nr:thioredoxin family protein [Acetobacter garciniae]MBX0345437.1 thioredoxin family protein [Acetobacter garciniae]